MRRECKIRMTISHTDLRGGIKNKINRKKTISVAPQANMSVAFFKSNKKSDLG